MPSDLREDIKADKLISAKDAYDIFISDEKAIFIQISKEDVFIEKHIPGAHQIWRNQFSSTQRDSITGMIAEVSQLQELLQNLGYTESHQLLLYDAKANVDAFRFAWILELYGLENYKVINGGLKFWESSAYPVTDSPTEQVHKSGFLLKNGIDSSSYACMKDIMEAMADTNTLIVDTREDYEFKGKPFMKSGQVFKYKPGAFERGKIPGSIHLPWSQLSDLTGDHRIKSFKDLEWDLNAKGISKEKNIIVYCQSGARSSHTYFILKHVLNFEHVKNYDGSWIEWSYNHRGKEDHKIEQLCNAKDFQALMVKYQTEVDSIKNLQI